MKMSVTVIPRLVANRNATNYFDKLNVIVTVSETNLLQWKHFRKCELALLRSDDVMLLT